MSTTLDSEDRPKLSVMLTCYRTAGAIEEMIATLDASLRELGWSYEIIIVDDASPDDTFNKVSHLFETYPAITHVIRLLRNVGQVNAITAAVVASSGQYIANIDTDLQYDCRDLAVLAVKLEESGCNMVSGVRTTRQDSFARRVVSRFTNVMVRLMTGLDLVDYGCALKIFDARVLRAFEFSPLRPFHPLAAIVAAGTIVNVPISHRSRKHGKSSWTFLRLYYYFTDLLVGLFQRPAHLGGVGLLLVSLLLAIGAAASMLASPDSGSVSNLTLLLFMVFMFLFAWGSSLIIFSLLLRTYLNTMRHPAYIIRTQLSRPFQSRTEER